MTKEEALKILTDSTAKNIFSRDRQEALDIAIEALTRETERCQSVKESSQPEEKKHAVKIHCNKCGKMIGTVLDGTAHFGLYLPPDAYTDCIYFNKSFVKGTKESIPVLCESCYAQSGGTLS